MMYQPIGLGKPTTLFLSFALAQPRPGLTADALRVLPAVMARVQRQRPFRLDAWVALPDRLDCVWTLPVGDFDTAGRWRAIRRGLASALGPGQTRWRAAEPGRQITGMADYADCVRRCWFAPVRHGLAVRPEDWAHSSIHQDMLPVG